MTNDAQTRTCTKCKIEKPVSEFYWRERKQGKKMKVNGGYHSVCKECEKQASALYRATYPEKSKAKNKAWRELHPSRVAEFKRTNRIQNIDRELAAEAGRRERYNRKHPGENSAYSKTWKKDNAAHVNAYCALRKAMKRNACPPWANLFFIEEAYDLAQRRTKATGFEWHVDHILPLKHKLFCGLHVEYNLQVIPAVENIRKKNHVPPELLGASIVC